MMVTTNNDNTILTVKSTFRLILSFAILTSKAQILTLLSHLLVCAPMYFQLMLKIIVFVEVCVALLARDHVRHFDVPRKIAVKKNSGKNIILKREQ